MAPVIAILAISFAATSVAMFALWLVSIVCRDVSIVDPFWGVGFVVVAWLAVGLNWPASPRVALITILTTIWGLRLAIYLLRRNWGQGEDRRYAAMRVRHGKRFWWISFFTVFLLQTMLLWFVSLPIQIAAALNSATMLGLVDVSGITLWLIGFFFETISDWQLARFKSDPANSRQVMDRGLWRYTRHPNYFGDFCVWWGLFVIAAAGGAWFTIVSPLLMSLLLLKVSGVALLEGSIADRRPDYLEYRKNTSTFFPWYPTKMNQKN